MYCDVLFQFSHTFAGAHTLSRFCTRCLVRCTFVSLAFAGYGVFPKFFAWRLKAREVAAVICELLVLSLRLVGVSCPSGVLVCNHCGGWTCFLKINKKNVHIFWPWIAVTSWSFLLTIWSWIPIIVATGTGAVEVKKGQVLACRNQATTFKSKNTFRLFF